MREVKIIKAQHEHFESIWEIFHQVIQGGDTYVYDPNTTKDEAYEIWMKQPCVYVALIDGAVAGSYIMKQNYPGLGSHVANCSYIVSNNFRGRGIGKLMGEHSLRIAKDLGFIAMQFNIVVSTNLVAVNLWKSIGFEIIATIPKSFNHKELGLVDSYVMHQFLK